jgi:uncharacterized protein (TIGR02284 family)
MIRPHSLDDETVKRLRELVAATYVGRDDLYLAAEHLNDGELAVICRKLADELAGQSAHLEQVILMQGEAAGGEEEETVRAALREEIMKFLREHGRDPAILSAAKKSQHELRDRYDATIAATEDSETQGVLKKQREEVDFGERVLDRIAKTGQ